MDNMGNLTSGGSAALILAFLQADCGTSEYKKELLSLGKDFNRGDINRNGPRRDVLDDGDLETDGHMSSCIIRDVQPSVELQWPGNPGEEADLQQIGEELREIADQLQHDVVADATQNLSRNISTSCPGQWKDHLKREVDRVMRQGVGLEHLPQERVIMALTLTLVKRVCKQTPRLLRNLFNAVLELCKFQVTSELQAERK
ncbi:BH3 interacting domain death agonist [Anoplopoma fimbria]|uniref:BH3 interacting domain death agonist n=1 Tax=Anoplopoma fimbria TaxID=229290 RepID=UPI0023ED4C85|nr:BH3 interacting domain death agonist [Anoplopoma fimbria]XP_054476556.1 BH3 interacting domain death agonist [Anoplopoma fimbria]XP_054476557.1 BH3 interacting domain death agonist [Anoplopoma fimbria]